MSPKNQKACWPPSLKRWCQKIRKSSRSSGPYFPWAGIGCGAWQGRRNVSVFYHIQGFPVAYSGRQYSLEHISYQKDWPRSHDDFHETVRNRESLAVVQDLKPSRPTNSSPTESRKEGQGQNVFVSPLFSCSLPFFVTHRLVYRVEREGGKSTPPSGRFQGFTDVTRVCVCVYCVDVRYTPVTRWLGENHRSRHYRSWPGLFISLLSRSHINAQMHETSTTSARHSRSNVNRVANRWRWRRLMIHFIF